MASTLLTVSQVATLLGMTRQGADWHSRRAGFPLPAATYGRVRLWREQDIAVWQAARGTKPALDTSLVT